MANEEILTDEYVANMLAQDAQDCSLKYSAMGMEAFRTNDKKPGNLPKPNTRFLRHIIKDTDTHNKNLLAKEAAESRARLEDLNQANEVKRLKSNPHARDIRRRQMGDIHAILGGKKKPRQTEGHPDQSRTRRKSKRDDSIERGSDKRNDDLFSSKKDHKARHGRLKEDDEEDRHRHSCRSDHRSGRRAKDTRSEGDEVSRRHRSRSPRHRRRSRSPGRQRSRHRHRSPARNRSPTPSRSDAQDAEDSDPLDDLLGPMPAPRPRGRGALAGSSGIDQRFSETYDPKADVLMDDGAGDMNWDDAVEAYRDRRKLQLNHSERMRTAGFSESQIQQAQGSEAEVDANVRWSKAGEKREWDKGKETERIDAERKELFPYLAGS